MIVAIIQARMGSTRLPGKMLMRALRRTVLEHVIARVQRTRTVDKTILATTTSGADKKLGALAQKLGIGVYCGSEEDVLDRYFEAARAFDAETIVRITGDCPLIDPEVIDRCVRFFEKNRFDYVSNVNPPTFPDGMDVEVFSFRALEKAWQEAALPSEREHVTPYIRNSGKFQTANVKNEIDMSSVRLTVDEMRDMALIKKLMEFFSKQGKPEFSLKEITSLWQKNPGFFRGNQEIRRNEGYEHSLKNDN